MSPRVVIALALALVTTACNDRNTSASPTAPILPVTLPQPNRPPTIVSSSIPSVAISGLTQVTFAAVAQDPDGDPLTYTWAYVGANREVVTLTGQSVTTTMAFAVRIQLPVVLEVSDGRGGIATTNASVQIYPISGRWASEWVTGNSWCASDWYTSLTMKVAADVRKITAEIPVSNYFCWASPGETIRNDPGTPVTIDDQGNFTMRLKKEGGDMFMQAQIQSNGRMSALVTYQSIPGFDSVRWTWVGQ